MTIFFKNKTLLFSFVIIGFVGLTVFSSCKSGNGYPKETATLDSLNVLVKKADSTLLKVDTNKIKKDNEHIMEEVQLIRMTHSDSMSRPAAEIFRNFYSIRWELETFLGRQHVMMLEMSKSMDQLSHLSHDLKYNLIKSDSIPMFYKQETKRAQLLIESEQIGIAKLNSQLPLYDLIVPQADSLIGLVKQHKKI